ncbi:MAG: Uma2 family endonuclease [Isosphaeraceae bacterium]|nr:Uma2 family endonuclease [Isosphaeraceae bacterium]
MTTQAHETPATGAGLQPYRVTVRQFERMIAAGLFGDDRVELLGGLLVMMTSYPPHVYAVSRIANLLGKMLPENDWTVFDEKPIRLGRFWRPQPDVTILKGPLGDYRNRRPRVADVALLIEVADMTYLKDSGPKLRRYAACRMPTYGIVHLPARQVEIHEGPTGRHYQHRTVYGEDDTVVVRLEGHEFGRLVVRDILP